MLYEVITYNHTSEICIYLDIRTFIGYDVAGYPDSNKILIAPTMEIFKNDSQANYFDGEKNIKEKSGRHESLSASSTGSYKLLSKSYNFV